MKAYLLIVYLTLPGGFMEEVGVEIMLSREDCTNTAYVLQTESPYVATCTLATFADTVTTIGVDS